MKAINLPHFKLKLRDVSRQLYIKHGWRMPLGLVDSAKRDPRNFTRSEWQQAKRAGQEARALKATFQDCWAISDSRKAFEQALASRGLYLAQGDRRGFVALDVHGEIYAVAKWIGVRAKDVRTKLGAQEDLPSIEEVRARVAELMTGVFKRHLEEADAAFQARRTPLEAKRTRLADEHRNARASLDIRQDARRIEESRSRAQRLPRGLRAVWSWLTGKTARIYRDNEAEAAAALQRDRIERQMLIDLQLEECRRLQAGVRQVRQTHTRNIARLHRDIAEYHQFPKQETQAVDDQGDTGQRLRLYNQPSR